MNTTDIMETVAVEPTVALVRAEKGSPLPAFTGAEMGAALTAYRDLQRALDLSMPDSIMTLDGKQFRKKSYWRAIAVAFNLTVEPVPGSERREVSTDFNDGRDNFGYVVTYRAVTASGRAATGDGSCFAVEKARRFRCPHPERPGSTRTVHFPAEACPDFDPAFQWRTLPAQATEHNIRSHAHTRAFNRAVSNLVGFGEVSAEEVQRDGYSVEAPPEPPARPTADYATTAAPPPQMQPRAEAAPGAVRIARVDKAPVRGGKTQGRVLFSDGVKASTVNDRLTAQCEQWCQDGADVVYETKQNGTFTNLVSVRTAHRDNEPELIDRAHYKPIDMDEIPFGWVLPLLLPALMWGLA